MKITIYEDTLEQAILDDDLTAEDKKIVEENMAKYVDFIVADFEENGDQVEVAGEASSPGPVYYAELENGHPESVEFVDFWEWCTACCN